MKAEALIDERHVVDVGTFVEIVVWRLRRPAKGSTYRFKYRLAVCGKTGKLGHCVGLELGRSLMISIALRRGMA